MNHRSRSGFMVIVGGYLAYLGFQLTRDTLKGEPGSTSWFLAFGILFLVLGIGVAAINIRKLIKEREEIRNMEEIEESQEDFSEENEQEELAEQKMEEEILEEQERKLGDR